MTAPLTHSPAPTSLRGLECPRTHRAVTRAPWEVGVRASRASIAGLGQLRPGLAVPAQLSGRRRGALCVLPSGVCGPEPAPCVPLAPLLAILRGRRVRGPAGQLVGVRGFRDVLGAPGEAGHRQATPRPPTWPPRRRLPPLARGRVSQPGPGQGAQAEVWGERWGAPEGLAQDTVSPRLPGRRQTAATV